MLVGTQEERRRSLGATLKINPFAGNIVIFLVVVCNLNRDF